MMQRIKYSHTTRRFCGLMLRFFFIAMLILPVVIPARLSAQSSLQYNRVLLVSSQQTVPAGTVWKVESVMHSGNMNASGTGLSWTAVVSAINVNGSTVFINRNTSASARYYYSSYYDPAASSDANLTQLPIWLPAGTTLSAGTNVNMISVIEFLEVAP